MKKVYVLLTKSNTLLSSAIHAVTNDAYTHVSVSIDPQLRSFYSFGRIHPQFALPAGFIRETLHDGYFGSHCGMPCALYELAVSDESFERISEQLACMRRDAESYRYSILGLILCKLDFAHERGRHFFCSQFVAKLLEFCGAICLPKPPSLMRPVDFTDLPGMRLLYCGRLGGAERITYASRLEGGFA